MLTRCINSITFTFRCEAGRDFKVPTVGIPIGYQNGSSKTALLIKHS